MKIKRYIAETKININSKIPNQVRKYIYRVKYIIRNSLKLKSSNLRQYFNARPSLKVEESNISNLGTVQYRLYSIVINKYIFLF